MKPFDDHILLSPSDLNSSPISPQPSRRKWRIWALCLTLGALIALIIASPLPQVLERFISIAENHYQEWLNQQDKTNPFVLLPLAFVGGLIASISPCILALLPVNLSYIGTQTITSRSDALVKASLFVLGNVTILSLFGLVSSFAGAVMVDYRGYITLAVGIIIFLMGLGLSGLIRIPWPDIQVNSPPWGAYGVGLTFALVSSPCASPVLFAVLASAAATGSQGVGVLTMTSYALGYTIIIFLASLLTGFAKQARTLLVHSETITRFGSIALLVAGVYYVITAVQWFL